LRCDPFTLPQAACEAGDILEKRVKAYLDECDPAISRQRGHNTTFRVACALTNGWALEKAEALKWLRYYNRKCKPPWNEKELEHKIDDALKAPHEKPRGYLLEGAGVKNSDQAEINVDWNALGLVGQADQGGGRMDPGPKADWKSAGGSVSPDGQQFTQLAIYPKDSILHDYMQFAISQTEGG
jgi:hypothetical protein